MRIVVSRFVLASLTAAALVSSGCGGDGGSEGGPGSGDLTDASAENASGNASGEGDGGGKPRGDGAVDGPETSDRDGGESSTITPDGGTAEGDAGKPGSSDAGPGTPVLTGKVVGTLLPVSDAPYLDALCAFEQRCRPDFLPGLSRDECRLVLSQPCVARDMEVPSEADGASGCAALLRDVSCEGADLLLEREGACTSAFENLYERLLGLAKLPGPGDSCGGSLVCTFDSECVGEAASGDGCGTCALLAEVGEACEAGQCRDGACVGGRCVAPGAEGAACVEERRPGGGSTLVCAVGLSCDASRRCVKPSPEGAKCTSGSVCAGDAQCVKGVCTSPLAAGASCSADADCDSYTCFEGKCAYIVQCTPAGEGAPCYRAGNCQDGLYCVDHHCVSTAPSDCSEQGCTASTFCDTRSDPPACVAKSSLGGACSGYGTCADGVCDSSTKKCEPGDLWDPCRTGAGCLSGNCLDGLCTASLTCGG